MPLEIERKYLVDKKNLIQELKPLDGKKIIQSYLSLDPNRAVRVRVKNDKGILTIKGKTQGISRVEFEYEIPKNEALELMNLCERKPISKTRYELEHKGKVWEIDLFDGVNEGLLIAEIELENESELIDLPEWIVKEVSDDERFYNLNLYLNPYKNWSEEL